MEYVKIDECSKDLPEEALNIDEIPPKVDEKENENATSNSVLTVPYILNGELYEILSRNGENVTVKCCSCPSGRFYRGSVRSTGNFHMHIKRRHPYLLGRLHAMKVSSLLERRDRLMKNRKAKLRRILVNNKGAKGEHEQHKLKIKRAFQRHQAEAKGNEQGTVQELLPTDLSTDSVPIQFTKIDVHTAPDTVANAETKNISVEFDESVPTSPQSSSIGCLTSEKSYCDVRILNVTQLTPPKNAFSFQQSTPLVTPYASTLSCESDVFRGYSPTCSHIKGENYAIESPLDLSRGRRASSPMANRSYGSSGIGSEPMWSKTTVENTISTAISYNELGSQNSSHSDAGEALGWQQRLAFIWRDIHNDMRARNRIEHNRLLLEIAKLKFLHPGFYFNLQE